MGNDTTDEIIRHYTVADEASRLRTGWFQLEYARTQEIILRHLPPPPAKVLDVGGAAGAYACWLASRGYQVHLIDPVPHHIVEACAASARLAEHPLASATLGDASRLQHSSQSADAVLLLGPLYHLTERNDRVAALREAHRVLRNGGFVWAAAISRFASLLDSLCRGFFDDADFVPILDRDLAEGQHRNPTGNLNYFTQAFFHLPDELANELTEAGFELIELVAVEGPGWLASEFDQIWNIPEQRVRLLAGLRKVEHEPALLGASSHILAIGRK
ncbi:MAG TPA: methyltransferase domain-containing protein [Candidatus Acidoferrum sp.]|nr:methyltransferase domain-containing protein [Candidatus Acidoferrum sp.]